MEEFVEINSWIVRRSQHVQMITMQTLGWTHLRSMRAVRERRARANDLYRAVIVSGLFQMRTAESKAFALAEAHSLTAQMNYLDNVSIHLLWVERQWGLGFLVSLDLGTNRRALALVDARVVSTP